LTTFNRTSKEKY